VRVADLFLPSNTTTIFSYIKTLVEGKRPGKDRNMSLAATQRLKVNCARNICAGQEWMRSERKKTAQETCECQNGQDEKDNAPDFNYGFEDIGLVSCDRCTCGQLLVLPALVVLSGRECLKVHGTLFVLKKIPPVMACPLHGQDGLLFLPRVQVQEEGGLEKRLYDLFT
jgi:hypothetical protein